MKVKVKGDAMAVKEVGLIGIGAMGRGMGKNLLQKGFSLTVYDLQRSAADSLVGLGAVFAESPKAVAERSEVVITVVPNGPDLEVVALGPEGVLHGGRPGLILMDCSTVDPSVTRRVGAGLSARGLKMVDAGMGRSSREAEAGRILFMVGADADDFETVKPLLDAMGDAVFHVGPPGDGITLKLVHNLLTLTILAASTEAMVLGAKAGLDVPRMLEVFQASTTGGFHMDNTIPNQVLKGEYTPGFRVALAHKDLGLGRDLAANLGVPLQTLAISRELYTAAMARGRGDMANGAIATVLEEIVGVRLADLMGSGPHPSPLPSPLPKGEGA